MVDPLRHFVDTFDRFKEFENFEREERSKSSLLKRGAEAKQLKEFIL